MLDQESLNHSDLDGLIGAFRSILRFKHGTAFFFTQTVGRTQYAAGTTQDVVLFNGPDGTGDVFKSKFSYKFTRLGISRAPLRTGGIMAKQAAIRLGDGLGQSQSFAHFLEFICVTHYFPPWNQFEQIGFSATSRLLILSEPLEIAGC
jgi:hypothetical protein